MCSEAQHVVPPMWPYGGMCAVHFDHEEMVSSPSARVPKVANVEKGEGGEKKKKKVTSNNTSIMAAKSKAAASNSQNLSAASNSQPLAANLLKNNGNQDTSNEDMQKLQEQLTDVLRNR